MNEPLPQIGLRSLRHQVVETLRGAIINGHFQPGDRLIGDELCQQLGVSRGPVREALRQLEQEGLVISSPYKATEVLGVSYEEMCEVLIPMRLTLERFAFRHALPQLQPDDFAILEQLVQAMYQAAQKGILERIVEADVRFHELVMDRSHQLHCHQIWRTISPRVRAYFHRCAPQHASLFAIVDEHRELLNVMLTRDLEQVLPILDEHILVDKLLHGLPK